MQQEPSGPQRCYTIKEVRQRLGKMSEESIYGLINTGELPSFCVGKRRYISDTALAGFIERRERDEAARRRKLDGSVADLGTEA